MPIAPCLDVTLGRKFDSTFATALSRLGERLNLCPAASNIASRSALPLLSGPLDLRTSENAKSPLTERAPTVLALLVTAESVEIAPIVMDTSSFLELLVKY